MKDAFGSIEHTTLAQDTSHTAILFVCVYALKKPQKKGENETDELRCFSGSFDDCDCRIVKNVANTDTIL